MRYDPKKIELKWQKKWLKEQIYEPDLKKAKRPFYNLMMFPYPSAEGLHIGAVRTFSGVDIYGRFKRMQGYEVFEPIGLDGFGIHSENYALKAGKHPIWHARDSEKNFYRQLRNIGNGFAWEEKLETYDPHYYKWTQWIFVQMFKHGLAYRKKALVNWCPGCKTVLADEQVIGGECERCQNMIIKKELEQWFFKITDYAERLLKNLEKIDWPESIKSVQRNWIGKSEGAIIDFLLKFDFNSSQKSNFNKIKVFTTRPDTLFGATYMVVAPEHALVKSLKLKVKNWTEVEEYIKKAKAKTEEERIAEGKEKTGVELKGVKAINPATKEEIPIWVADYVLGNVGTGAIMAVPAHDERDFDFARKYKLSVREVVVPNIIDKRNPPLEGKRTIERRNVHAIVKDPNTGKYLAIKWKKFNWVTFPMGGVEEEEDVVSSAIREVKEETGFTNLKFIKVLDGQVRAEYFASHKDENRISYTTAVVFELIDYTRVEVNEDEKEAHGVMWLDESQLNYENMTHAEIGFWNERLCFVTLAYVGDGVLINSGKFSGMDSEKAKWEITKFVGGERKVKYRLRDWLISRQRYWGPPIPMIYCERCDWQPVPEKDLPVKLPDIKNFRPTGTEKSPLATVEKFYKVRCPQCRSWARRETDVSDTFLDSAWYYIGYLMKFGNWKLGFGSSAFAKLTRRWLPVDMYIGGPEHAVLHLLYVRFLSMTFHDWGLLHFEEPFKKFRTHGLITKDGFKMSKSRGNVVSPDEYIRAYGVDAIRMYLAFLAPFDQGGDFRDTGIRGLTRFLERVWRFFENTKHKIQSTNKTQNTKPKTQTLERLVHRTIKKVTEDIETLQYHTAISALMMLLNEFESNENEVSEDDWKIFLKLLAPFAPFITEELWHLQSTTHKLQTKSIHLESWPKYDPKFIQKDTFELVIQVNGKVRGRINMPVGIGEAEAKKAVFAVEQIKKYVTGEPRKVIFVPNKLINFVL